MDIETRWRISLKNDLTTIFWFFSLILLSISIATTGAVESITGRRQACSNEGEEVRIDAIRDFRCFKCICQNGFVECEQESCPSVDDCYMLERKPPGGCCEKCKECVYKGIHYPSGVDWSDPEDPCIHFKCVAGVITETTQQCYTPCSNPLPPRPGQCCPTCLGCFLNGQKVHDGREVTLTEDPCLKCQCSNRKLTCSKKACPVLQCPITKQIRVPGECCPKCTERREIMQVPGKCILGKGFHSDGKRFTPDHCSMCTCVNGTSVCRRNTCAVLECSPEFQETNPGECCPHCPIVEEVRSTCTYNGRSFANNETWNLDPCRSCRCHGGAIRCAQTKCPKVKCRPNETLITPEGQCCSKCIESAGVCTVFGDPHYKTFDGKFFSFQGSCKYQLTSDCRDHTFSVRVTNDARRTKLSSWTKSITLKVKDVRVNLGQKMRVKVNGSRISFPFNLDPVLRIERLPEGLLVTTELGVRIEWDGNNFLQIQVPATYKNKLCGLCGNYNGLARDDLTSRDGSNHSDLEVWRFANSWRVGGKRPCSRKNDNIAKQPTCKPRRGNALCKPLRVSEISNLFGDCGSKLNSDNYFEACKMDMCECPHSKCYCDSFAAYAHECRRLGVQLPDWREIEGCPIGGLSNKISRQFNKEHHSNSLQIIQHHQQRPRLRKRPRRPDYYTRHVPETLLIQKTTGRTPPPLH